MTRARTSRAPRLGRTVAGVALVVLALASACKKSGKIGVTECDEYLEKAERCAEKGGTGEALRMSNELLLKSWTKGASDSSTKKTLPTVCKAALEGARKAYTACEW